MALLLENPLPIWALGVVCLAVSLIVFFAKRSLGSVLTVVGVVAVTLLLVSVEQVVITPSEEIEQSLADVLEAIKSNDLPQVLTMIDPNAQRVRADAETLMPQVTVKETGSTSVRVEIDESANPPQGTSYFRGRVDGTHRRNGIRVFFFDQVEIDWQRNGDAWQIVDYRVMHRGQPVKATDAFRTAR